MDNKEEIQQMIDMANNNLHYPIRAYICMLMAIVMALLEISKAINEFSYHFTREDY